MTVSINVSSLIAKELESNGLHTSKDMIDGIIKETVAQMIAQDSSVLTHIMSIMQAQKEQETSVLRKENRMLKQLSNDLSAKQYSTEQRISALTKQLGDAVKQPQQKVQAQKEQTQQPHDGKSADFRSFEELLSHIFNSVQTASPKNKHILDELRAMSNMTQQSQQKVKPQTKSDILTEQLAKMGIEVVDLQGEMKGIDFGAMLNGFPFTMAQKPDAQTEPEINDVEAFLSELSKQGFHVQTFKL